MHEVRTWIALGMLLTAGAACGGGDDGDGPAASLTPGHAGHLVVPFASEEPLTYDTPRPRGLWYHPTDPDRFLYDFAHGDGTTMGMFVGDLGSGELTAYCTSPMSRPVAAGNAEAYWDVVGGDVVWIGTQGIATCAPGAGRETLAPITLGPSENIVMLDYTRSDVGHAALGPQGLYYASAAGGIHRIALDGTVTPLAGTEGVVAAVRGVTSNILYGVTATQGPITVLRLDAATEEVTTLGSFVAPEDLTLYFITDDALVSRTGFAVPFDGEGSPVLSSPATQRSLVKHPTGAALVSRAGDYLLSEGEPSHWIPLDGGEVKSGPVTEGPWALHVQVPSRGPLVLRHYPNGSFTSLGNPADVGGGTGEVARPAELVESFSWEDQHLLFRQLEDGSCIWTRRNVPELLDHGNAHWLIWARCDEPSSARLVLDDVSLDVQRVSLDNPATTRFMVYDRPLIVDRPAREASDGVRRIYASHGWTIDSSGSVRALWQEALSVHPRGDRLDRFLVFRGDGFHLLELD